MSLISSAAEAAARLAAEAARRAAEAAAKRAAEAAARQAAQAAQVAARTAQASPRPVADRFDPGTASAGVRLGAPPMLAPAQDLANQALNSVAATSLLTEDVHDGAENCLDASIERAANTGGEVILLDPAEDFTGAPNAGHAIVRDDQGYWDPRTPEVTYETFEDWQSASSNGSMYQLTELGADPATGEPVGIDGRTLYDVTATGDPDARAAKLRDLSQELGVPASFFGGHQYANGGSITVPAGTPATTFAADPGGVRRVDVDALDEPLRSQLLSANTIEENTGAGSGVDMVTQGGNLYVAIDSSGQLVDIQDGEASVFHTGTVNTLSIFANVDMSDPAAVASAYGDALQLTRGGDPVQPLVTSEPLTPEQVQAYQELGYTVAVLDPANGRAAVRTPDAADSDIANIGGAGGAEPVYVLVGGPAIPGIAGVPPERVADISAQAEEISEMWGGRTPIPADVAPEVFGLDESSSPAEWALYAGAVARTFPPESYPSSSLSGSPNGPYLAMLSWVESGAGPEGRFATASVLASAALDPTLPEGASASELAVASLRMATTPEEAQRLLDLLGPERSADLLAAIHLPEGEGTDPSLLISGSPHDSRAHHHVLDFANLIADLPPSPGRDAFNLALLDPKYHWHQPTDIHDAAVAAWTGRFMAMPDGPEKVYAAQEYFLNASEEMWSVDGFPEELATTMAGAMSPDDPARRAELEAQLQGIFTSPAGPQLFGDRSSPEQRVQFLQIFADHPEYDAAWLSRNQGPDGTAWTHPGLMEAVAETRAGQFFNGRGDAPATVSLDDASLENLIGQGFGMPPSATDAEAFFANVANGYAQPPASDTVNGVTGPIRDWAEANGVTQLDVTVLPIQYSSSQYGTVDLPLFRVDDPSRPGEHVFFDNQGNRYDDFEEWRTENQLPPGTVVYPEGGHLIAEGEGGVALASGNTPKTPDTFKEHVFQVLDTAALVGGVVAGGVLIIGSGGTLAPAVVGAATVVAGASSAWGAYRAAEGLFEQADLGRSLNPFENGQAGLLWLDLGANAVGLGSMAANFRASRLIAMAAGGGANADELARMASSAGRLARTLDVIGAGLDATSLGANAVNLAVNWDSMSEGDRLAALGQLVFFGTMSAAQAQSVMRYGPDVLSPAAPPTSRDVQPPHLGATNGFLEYGREAGLLPVMDQVGNSNTLAGRVVEKLQAQFGGELRIELVQPDTPLVNPTTGQPLVDPLTGETITLTTGGYTDPQTGTIYLTPDANLNVLVHEADHAVFLRGRGHWNYGDDTSRAPSNATLLDMEARAYEKNVRGLDNEIARLTTERDGLDPEADAARIEELDQRIANLGADRALLGRAMECMEAQRPALIQIDQLDAQIAEIRSELAAETAGSPEHAALEQELASIQGQRGAAIATLQQIEADHGFSFGGINLDPEQRRKLREAAAKKDQEMVTGVDQVPELNVTSGDFQQYGSITPETAQILASISAQTGVDITVYGSMTADPALLSQARLQAGDVVVIDGQTVARPPNDYDFALSGGTAEQRAQARAMINRYILVPQGKTADWLGSALGGPAGGHPYLSLSGGEVTGSSVGNDAYYQNAAIKRRSTGHTPE